MDANSLAPKTIQRLTRLRSGFVEGNGLCNVRFLKLLIMTKHA